MNSKQLKEAIEIVAKEEGITELEAITKMQTGAAMTNQHQTIEILCDLKWDYIDLGSDWPEAKRGTHTYKASGQL